MELHVGPETPTTTNDNGGSQSDIPYRFDLIDPLSMFEMSRILHSGAKKYGENNWRRIPVNEHLNHMIMHAYAFIAGDTQENHLAHVLCRAMFAQAILLQGGPYGNSQEGS